jgi:hypothetical protein
VPHTAFRNHGLYEHNPGTGRKQSSKCVASRPPFHCNQPHTFGATAKWSVSSSLWAVVAWSGNLAPPKKGRTMTIGHG